VIFGFELPIGNRFDTVDGGNVGMVECGQNFLAAEARMGELPVNGERQKPENLTVL
jgi:hypothetical protein